MISREPSGWMRRPEGSVVGGSCEAAVGDEAAVAASAVVFALAAVVASGVAPISFRKAFSSESACSSRALAEP